jgi:nucleotide-binding universal stress UspA family protein
MIHVDREEAHSSWQEFPHVRSQLARWGLLPADSPPDAIHRLGLSVEKVLTSWHSPASVLEEYVHYHPTDLMVLATHQREGLRRRLTGSIAEELILRAHVPTLLVPDTATTGFLDPVTGKLALHDMLLPINHSPSPALLLKAARRFAAVMNSSAVHARVLHVGRSMPGLKMGDSKPCRLEWSLVAGDPVEEITAMADRQSAALVVMVTEGRRNLKNWLWGSTVQRVSRWLRCPLLVVSSRTDTSQDRNELWDFGPDVSRDEALPESPRACA